MGYGTNGLTFNTLRAGNVHRLPQFKDKHGRRAHAEPDGSDWSLGEWMNAVLGELGECANIIKKLKRGDYTLEEAKPLIAKELADVVTYVDLTAFQLRIDLGEAIMEKFNEVSARVGSNVVIDHEDWHYRGAATPFVNEP